MRFFVKYVVYPLAELLFWIDRKLRVIRDVACNLLMWGDEKTWRRETRSRSDYAQAADASVAERVDVVQAIADARKRLNLGK